MHDGSFGNAINLIKCAKEAGATAVKFQLHISEAETLRNAPNPKYFNQESRFDYFERISFDINQWNKIKDECKKNKIKFVCSPFSEEAIKILDEIGVDAYKVPSGELTNIPYLNKLKETKKNCFISTGMSNYNEIDTALKILNSPQNTVMQCSSIYPCPPNKVGLNVIQELLKRYKCNVGLSDHTTTFAAALGAISLGAKSIEKHITFSKDMYGSDAKNAMELVEFKTFCNEIKNLDTILNNPINKNSIKPYTNMRKTFMKSIVASKDLSKGHVISLKDLAFKKPGDGILSNNYMKIIGKKTSKDIFKNAKINLKDLI